MQSHLHGGKGSGGLSIKDPASARDLGGRGPVVCPGIHFNLAPQDPGSAHDSNQETLLLLGFQYSHVIGS